MRNLLQTGKVLLQDMAATVFFLLLYLLTDNVPLSVALGMALGVAQLAWQKWQKKPVDTLQWVSLVLVISSGVATLVTQDVRFVLAKASVIYVIVGVTMLKPGWLNRYLPPLALELMPDLGLLFGFVWAGLMFFSAALNLVIALKFGIVFWASFMSVYGIVSKLGLFLFQYAVMRMVGGRRFRALAMA